MLVAELDGDRVEAETAEKGPVYTCPKCKSVAILKQGRKVVWHFAHKPPTDCTWATGETKAHLEAKGLVAKELRKQGVRAEVEFVVPELRGDRRADVMAFNKKGARVAIELQHCSLSLDELERRAKSYASAGVAQLWIPFIPPNVWKDGDWNKKKQWFLARYSARPFEKWVHGFNGNNGMWMYDPAYQRFWLARLAKHEIEVPSSNWYNEYGEDQSAGGYTRISKRYRELTMDGPYELSELQLMVGRRKAFSVTGYNWPGGLVGRFAQRD